MSQTSGGHPPPRDDNVSIAAVAITLIRHGRLIIVLALLGGIYGLISGLTSPRMFVSTTTFVPQGSEGMSGLAAAAGQFGIRVPTTSGGTSWGPAVYVELARSPVLLAPIAKDTLHVAELKGRAIPVEDLLIGSNSGSALERSDATIRALSGIISPTEVRTFAAVKISVATPWPSVSLALVQRLLRGVNTFNLETRKSQARSEREFVEGQASEAEAALRDAEGRLQDFLQRNRVISGSPELEMQRARIQRDVTLHQQVYQTLLQSRAEARIREVRDTPVITVLEEPRLAIVGEPRKAIQKAILGGITGIILGVVLAFAMDILAHARLAPDPATRELFHQMQMLVPRFLRRGRQ